MLGPFECVHKPCFIFRSLFKASLNVHLLRQLLAFTVYGRMADGPVADR